MVAPVGGDEGGGDGGTLQVNTGVPPDPHATPETDCVGQKAVVWELTRSEYAETVPVSAIDVWTIHLP